MDLPPNFGSMQHPLSNLCPVSLISSNIKTNTLSSGFKMTSLVLSFFTASL